MYNPIVDLHVDTISCLVDGAPGTLAENSLSVSLAHMEAAGRVVSCFAMFTDIQQTAEPWLCARAQYERLMQEIQANPNRIRQVSTAEELVNNPMQGAILSCEELAIIEGKLERIGTLASWGVKISTLVWNHENEFGYPNHMAGGLKRLGFQAVEALEECGILVDVSHLNDDGFFDLASSATKPFIASHSNCRAITNHSRNLSDKMIHILADHGGVVGLNFCPSFLSEDWSTSHIADMVRHTLHLRNMGGRQVLALGTDLDGISGALEIPHYDTLARLWEALAAAGLSDDELEGMMGRNALRVLGADS